MARLEKGQVRFGDMPPKMRTCHDIRAWRGCPHCGHLGHKDNMIQSGEDFWHGRCFDARYGTEMLIAHKRDQLERLTLGDLGVRLMTHVLGQLYPEELRARIAKPYLKRMGSTYDVFGKTGNHAGIIGRVKNGWHVQMHSRPRELYETFQAAKTEALMHAEAY